MEQVDGEGTQLYNGVKRGEYWRTDIQVAINKDNCREHGFFVIRIGKGGTSMPFQQPIPRDFARYHPKLHLKNITLEVPCGRSWEVVLLAHSYVVRFGKGWKQFSVENSLREGCHLLFTLVGKSHFMVKFFDNLGKSQASFPPLADAVQSQSLPRDEEHAFEPPLEPALATPSAAPQGRPGALNGDGMETEHEAHEEQAIAEGEHYINLDSDDELVSPEASFTPVKRTVPKWNVGDIYSVMKNKGDELHSGEQTGFHSPGKVHTVRRGKNVNHLAPDYSQEHDGEIHDDSEEDDHFTVSKSSSDDVPLQRLQRQSRVRKKVSMKRPSWEGEGKGKGMGMGKGKGKVPSSARFSTFDDHHNIWGGEKAATRRSSRRGYHEVRDTSERRAAQKRNAIREDSMESMNLATRLLRQQQCVKFSQIVSKCNRRHVSDKERTSVVNAAKRFALGLENEKFLVVMRDTQVYHGFHLAIPRAILEVTGTQRANKVQAYLIGEQENLYVANWAWHSFCESPLLSRDEWAKFSLDHTIEEGDVCVFELSTYGPAIISGFLFRVHIFRVAETPWKQQDSSIHELHGAQTPLNNTWGMKSSAAVDPDWEPRHDRGKKRRPVDDLRGPSPQKHSRGNNAATASLILLTPTRSGTTSSGFVFIQLPSE